ncbi:phage tail sheath subtilisin-like domain-containing protein [Snodgrassella sp. CFCC 13594]|uniref:phage tail sheath subtilisin-like domain-containing protein n=1 Tax=Snodgrassella sp. CFCC 13594 TaxID=1775559 RepID=UPI000834F1FF|nr:phage tail sheath subtilisin-like domain-containing protein [Snodgrassella sp. CFCC 13594]
MANQVSFDTIPSSIRVPGRYIEFNTRNAVRGLPQNPQKMLLVAPMLSAGKQAALEPVQLFSDADAADLFGSGSWAHRCVTQAFTNNAYLDLTVIGVADAEAGVAATGSVTFTGTATSVGVATVTIGGTAYQTSISSGDTAADIATRLRTVVNVPDTQVTAAGAAGTLALTAKNKGAIGNEISVSATCTASDISFAVTAFASGDVNGDIGPALDVVAGKRYQVICSAFTDDANAAKLSDHIEAVSNAIEKRGCIGVMGWRGTLATGTTFAGKLNDGRITVAWYKKAIEGNAVIAAGYAAVLAYEEDPAKPLNTLEVKGLTVTPDSDWPLYAEFNSALYNGLTPLEVKSNKVQIMRAVSTYTTNATGTDDPALLDITTIRTLDYVRDAVDQRIALRFPRDKLSSKTPRRVKSEILDVLLKCEDAEILEEVMANKNLLVVQRNGSDVNRLDAIIPADVVNGLHVFAARIDLYL